VARSVDKIQDIFPAVFSAVIDPHRRGLDRNAALAFQVHIIEKLILKFAFVDSAGKKQQTVRQRGLAVIDMRNNGKITD